MGSKFSPWAYFLYQLSKIFSDHLIIFPPFSSHHFFFSLNCAIHSDSILCGLVGIFPFLLTTTMHLFALPCTTKTSLKVRTLSKGSLFALLWQQKHLHNSQWCLLMLGDKYLGFKGGSFLGGSDSKESVNLPKCKRHRFNPWVVKIPWRREWQLLPVLLPGEFHRQRSLVGYHPWDRKQSDMTERLTQSVFSWLQISVNKL